MTTRSIMTTNNIKQSNNRQQGMALVISMIMLLAITLLGVSAVRMSSQDTQIAGNNIFSAFVFQGAESALSRSASSNDWSNLPAAAILHDKNNPFPVPNSYFTPVEVVTGGATLNLSGTIAYEGIINGPVFNNVANSSTFNYQVFTINGRSRLASTSARDRHTEGRAVQIPKP